MNRRKIGNEFETLAAAFLQKSGAVILARNYSCKFGEIDIIIQDDEALAFVEVKYRRYEDSGYPEEAVTPAKQRKISRTADYYCLEHQIPEDTDCRFDVIAIDRGEIRYYKNAFPHSGQKYF